MSAEMWLVSGFIAANLLYFLSTGVFLLFSHRPWRWVAALKIFAFFTVLTFQLTASAVWLVYSLPAPDIIIYTAWSLVLGWLAGRKAKEGLRQFLLLTLFRGDPEARANWRNYELRPVGPRWGGFYIVARVRGSE